MAFPSIGPSDVFVRALVKDRIKRLAIDFPAEVADNILDDDALLDNIDDQNADIWAAAMVEAWKTGGQAAVYATFADRLYAALAGSKPTGPKQYYQKNVLFSWKGLELAVKVLFNEFIDRVRQNASIDLEKQIIPFRDRFNQFMANKVYAIRADNGEPAIMHGKPAISWWRYAFSCSLPQPSKGHKCPKPETQSAAPSSSSASSGTAQSSATSSTTSSSSSPVSTQSVESSPPFTLEKRQERWPQELTKDPALLIREAPLFSSSPTANGSPVTPSSIERRLQNEDETQQVRTVREGDGIPNPAEDPESTENGPQSPFQGAWGGVGLGPWSQG